MSNAWKALEREAARELGGKRILRGADFSVSSPDIFISDHPELKIDCKYRQRHAHHKTFKEIKKKYCKEEKDIPVLITKQAREEGFLVTITSSYFNDLLFDRYKWKLKKEGKI